MELSGERHIAAPKEKIWAALNDPAILNACIPGCQTVEKISATELRVEAVAFTGKVLLSDLDPPNGATVAASGQTGSAPVEGGGRLELAGDAGGTKISYRLHTGAGQATQGQNAINAFFDRLSTAIAEAPSATNVIPDTSVYHLAHEDHDHDPSNPHMLGLPIGVILATVVAVVSVGIVLAKFFVVH